MTTADEIRKGDQFYQFDKAQYKKMHKTSGTTYPPVSNAEVGPEYEDSPPAEGLDKDLNNENLGTEDYNEGLGNGDGIDNEFDNEKFEKEGLPSEDRDKELYTDDDADDGVIENDDKDEAFESDDENIPN